jgi:chaperonin GroES
MKRHLTLAIGCLAFAVPAFANPNLSSLSRNTGAGSLKTHKQQQTSNNTNTMAKVNVRPLGDRVLVQPLEEAEVKKGGIIIPDTAKEKPQEGKVVALGTGKRDDDGKIVPFTVKAGDTVLISKYGGTEIKVDGNSYLIMREDDILGIIG